MVVPDYIGVMIDTHIYNVFDNTVCRSIPFITGLDTYLFLA
jgi:hypothetical protein